MSLRAVFRIVERKGRNGMRKLILLAALLAMVLLAAVPAMAQLSQENEQEGESGDFDQSIEVKGGGSNSNQCVGIQGVGNTGNSQNVIDILAYEAAFDDMEFEEVGSDITVGGSNETRCDQQVNQ